MPAKDDLHAAAKAELKQSLGRYQEDLTNELISIGRATVAGQRLAKRVNHRKIAFDHYQSVGQVVCAHCGFGIHAVLEVAHLDCNHSNNALANLAILCPTCHRMHDLNLIPTETIILMRDRPKIAVWAKLMKDAGAKAANTRQERLKWKKAGKKAAETRKRNAALQQPS